MEYIVNNPMMEASVMELTDTVSALMLDGEESVRIFDETAHDFYASPVPGWKREKYVRWGYDNELPYKMINLIGKDEVMAENKFFNVLTCFGGGLEYMDRKTGRPSQDPEVLDWLMHNDLTQISLEMATDMKYFFFSLVTLVLSKDGKKVNKIRHHEACHVRFQVANHRGIIEHVYLANWKNKKVKQVVDRIELLDMDDPLGDLRVRMGVERDPKTGQFRTPTATRRFAMVVKFPTAGCQYYPIPYYTSLFRGDWYDIKRLIAKGKKAKLKNHVSLKYIVSINDGYWDKICAANGKYDAEERKAFINETKEQIRDFLSGIENSGKIWYSGFMTTPDGKTIEDIKVTTLTTNKEGGDWSEDIEEASNITCYADNIHPNLVGATPGKSQTNNSGSDKRELFTLKQSMEISFHKLMYRPHQVAIAFNEWKDIYPDTEIVLLTTLDQHTDAVTTSANHDTNLD